MRSSTSSSDLRFVAAFVATFLVLAGSWEAVLRQRSSATVDVSIKRPPMRPPEAHGERWVVFGNCLVMTGISPKQLSSELEDGTPRTILNIASHEQSPVAYFDYLRRSQQYPDVIVANASSWINGTNFDQEAELITKQDPLRLHEAVATPEAAAPAGSAAAPAQQAYKQGGEAESGAFQKRAEATLSKGAGAEVRAVGHRYHLFDYALFAGKLATSGNLDNALYQLNMQSWFRVTGSETDGFGFLGLHVAYRDDWTAGLEQMAERSLQRLQLQRLLTPRYWTLFTEAVNDFKAHGTRIVLVRMPEHPRIREFNDRTYQLSERLGALAELAGTPVLDLSKLGPAEGVRLFDGVHPDADAAVVITRELSSWVKARHIGAERTAP
jgi:hypothetical protein